MIQKIKVANSEGYFAEEERIYTLFLVHAIASENETIQTGYEAVGGLKGIELLKKYHLKKLQLKLLNELL